MSGRSRRDIRRAAGFALAALIVGGCHSDSTGPNPQPTPAFVVVTPSPLLLTPRDSTQLSVGVLDKDSALITGVPVTFTSSDTSVVQVSAAGQVRAAATVGVGQVTVSAGNAHATVPIQVAGTPVLVSAQPTDTTITEGRSFQYRFRLIDSLGDSIRYAPVASFQIGDSVGLHVSAGGVVTGASGGPNTVQVRIGTLSSGILTVVVNDTNVVAHIPLAGAPYGVAVTSGGAVYVAPIIGTAIHRIALPGGTLADSATLNGGGDPAQIAFNATGDTAFVTKRAAGALAVVGLAAGAQVDSVVIPGDPYAVAVDGAGHAFVGTGNGQWLYRVDLGSRTRTDSTAVTPGVYHMAMGVGDSLVYVGLQSLGEVDEVRTATLAVKRTFTTPGKVQAVATSGDGTELYVANETGPLRIISLATGTQTDSVKTLGGSFGVTVSSDGATLGITTVSGYVYFLNRSTRALRHRVYVGGTPRLIRIDPVSGLAVIANEGGAEVDVVR